MMRQRLRSFGLLALAVVAITCTDAPTSPDGLRSNGLAAGHVQLAPSFSPEAARAYKTLSAFGVVVTEIHIRLTGPDASVRDTVLAFPAGQDSITVDIPVPMSGTDQPFSALIELRNDQHVVLFSGTQVVFARASGLPRLTSPPVLIQYTGPGKSTKTVAVGPSDTTVSGPVSVALRATGVDNANLPVTDLLVQFTVSDATLATVTSTGSAAATLTSLGRRGIATISATTPLGITGTTRMTFVPAAARVVLISGDNQTGVAGSALAQPLVVEVQAADNLPVPGAPVAFRAVTAGGSVQQATAIADGAGRATSTLTLGKTAGTYQYRAASGALAPVTVNATATPAPPALLVIESGNNQIDSIGRTLALPLVVKVTDQYGGFVNNAKVLWSKVTGPGTLGLATSLSDVNGLASNSYTLGNVVGLDTVRATVSGIPGPDSTVLFSMRTISRAPASILIVSGGGQSGAPNDVLPAALVARVADSQNNPVSNVTVSWTSAGATFAPASSATNASGLATTIATLGATPGTVTVTASGGGFATNTTLTITGNTPPPPTPSMTIVAGNQQTAPAGANVPVAPSVLVKDGANNPVANAAVVFTVSAGGGSVTGGTTTTNAQGIATVGSWTLGAAPGPNTLTATSGSLSVNFLATGVSAGPTHFAFVLAPPAQFVVGSSPVTISAHLLDAQNSPVQQAGVAVTFAGAVSPGPNFGTVVANTDATGTATILVPTYTGPIGSVVLSVTSPGLTSLVTSPIPIVTGAVSAIVVATQPATSATSGTPFSPQPVTQLVDAGGNPVTTAGTPVVATIATGGGTLSGTTTVNTDATGKAVFTNLAITGSTGSRTLQFTAGSLSVQSNAISVTSVATSISLNGWTVASSTAAGAPFVPQPTVQLVDANNLPVSTAGVVISATVASGPTSPTPVVLSATATTNANGQAVFAGLGIGGAVGTYTLSFSAPSITPATSNPLTISAGTPASIAINAGQGQSAAVATAVAIPPSVKVVDAFNNPVAGVGVTFTASGTSLVSNGTTTAPSLGATTNPAGITSLAWILGTTPGAYTLTATSGSLTGSPLTFNATATAGPPAALAFVTPPSSSASSGAPLAVQPVIQLKDAQGNDIATAGVVITASITSGTGTLTNTSATTTSAGTATLSGLTITGTVGNFTLQFSAAGFTALSFGPIALSAGAPTAIAIVAGDLQSAAAGTNVAIAPSVRVTDGAGNPLQGISVTFTPTQGGGSVTGGVAVTNVSGVATVGSWQLGNTAGPNSLDAAAGSLHATFTATGISGTATQLAFVTSTPATASSGVALSPQPSVQLLDANGNPVSTNGVVVTATVASGLGSVTGATATTVGGLATFSGLTITGTAGAFTLRFSATSLTPLVSPTIALSAGTASALLITTQPGATVQSGSLLSPQPVIQLIDGAGNPVAQAGVGITAQLQTGSGSLTGTLVVNTNGSGQAAFTDLVLSGIAGIKTLRFTSSVGGVNSANITVTSAPVTQLVVTLGNNQVGSILTTLPQQIIVEARDAQNLIVPGILLSIAPQAANPTRNGTPSVSSATTNGSGQVSFTWKLSRVSKPDTVVVATPGNTVTRLVLATATPAPFSQLVYADQPGNGGAVVGGVTMPPLHIFASDSGGLDTIPVITAVTLSIRAGTGTSGAILTGGGPVSTASNGVVTFTNLSIDKSGTGYILDATNGTFTGASLPFNVGTGSATNIRFSQQPSNGTGGASIAPTVTVTLVDAGGNTVPVNTTTVTLSIATGTGTAGATLVGGGPITFVNGVASFPSASIDFGGTAYKLLAATTALNAQGAPITSITSVAFDIIPGSTQLLTTKVGRRINVSPVGAVNPPTGSRPVFVARNAAGNPAPNLTINLVSTGRCRLDNGSTLVTSLSMTTDVNGEVTPLVRLPAGAGGAGCLVKASGPSFTTSVDSSQLAVFPAGTSHVWFGAASGTWTDPANWIPVISVPPVPSSSSDVVFIPNFNAGVPVVPVVSGPKPSMNRLAMDTSAIVSLGNIGIDIGSGGVTGFGVTNSGSIHVQASASVNGIFDILDMGQSGSCGASSPMQGRLLDVGAITINIRCHTFIDTTGVSAVTLNVFPNLGQGWLELTSNRAGVGVTGNANFTGDSLWVVGGVISVNGTSNFGGGVSWTGGTLNSIGDATFASDHAFYSNASVLAQGNATFGGSGAGQQQFAGGALTVLGNFSQIPGTKSGQTDLTFTTSSDHATVFAGSTTQTVSFATPTASRFSVFRAQNTSPGGVQIATDAQSINGTAQPRIDVVSGRLQVNAGMNLTLNRGSVLLGFQSNLNLLGNIVNAISCNGRTTNSATVTGTGTFNGGAITSATCTP